MRANLLSLVVLLLLLGLGARYAGQPPKPQGLVSLQLLVRSSGPSREEVKLQLDARGWSYRRVQRGKESQPVSQTWQAGEFDRLAADLERAGAWRLEDGDSGQPEEQVLYTELELVSAQQMRRSRWRGLPAQQQEVAQVLLDTPTLGSYLGLEIGRLNGTATLRPK